MHRLPPHPQTGFDRNKGRPTPVLDGVIVAEAHAPSVEAAADAVEQLAIEKSVAKRQARVLGNWKRLVNAQLLRERIQREYTGEDGAAAAAPSPGAAPAGGRGDGGGGRGGGEARSSPGPGR